MLKILKGEGDRPPFSERAIGALHDLDTIDGSLIVRDNASLPTSAAQALADAIPDKAGATVADNGPG